MKYLFLVLLCFSACAHEKPKTLDSCMDEVERKVDFNKAKDDAVGIFIMCRMGKNDPDTAMQILDSLRYAH